MAKQIFLSKATQRFKVVMDECWKVERPEVRNEARQWYQQIPCRGGAFIGLYSETPPTFQLSTPRAQNAKNIWQQIKHKPGCRADFHFDGEAILFFPPEQLDVVAEGAGARVKRQGRPMTPEQKAKLAEMGREALKKLREATSQTHKIDPNLIDFPEAMGLGQVAGVDR
jgi:hypothetical protein